MDEKSQTNVYLGYILLHYLLYFIKFLTDLEFCDSWMTSLSPLALIQVGPYF